MGKIGERRSVMREGEGSIFERRMINLESAVDGPRSAVEIFSFIAGISRKREWNHDNVSAEVKV